jgi:hypothetical protein
MLQFVFKSIIYCPQLLALTIICSYKNALMKSTLMGEVLHLLKYSVRRTYAKLLTNTQSSRNSCNKQSLEVSK